MNAIFSADVLSSMMRVATPILLCALGGLMCHKSGIVNIAMEGLALMGAFGAVAVVQITGGNVWLGYLGAIVCSTAVSLIMALMVLKFNANQIITSIGINMLASGLTAFLLRAAFGVKGALTPDSMEKIPPIDIPVIKDIPVIGQLFSGHYFLVYVAIIMTIVMAVMLKKTTYGLRIISVGESPQAAGTAGLNVKKLQLGAMVWTGVLCGLAGAFLSTSMVSGFTENMVSGRGFTAFTAIAFADGNPIGTALVCLLFGFAEALGIRIEIAVAGISSQVIEMFPYFLALIVLSLSSYFKARKIRNSGKTAKAKQ